MSGGFNIQRIAAADIDPALFQQLAQENSLRGDDMAIHDETSKEAKTLSDADWGEFDRSFQDEEEPEKGPNISALQAVLLNPSRTVAHMSEEIMDKGKQMLMDQLGSKAQMTEQDATTFVTDWARTSNRTLTPAAVRALSSALAMNFCLGIGDLDKVLLGWDLRGEHNINEVKNVLDSHQETLNNVLTSQKEFKDNVRSLVSGFKTSADRILTHNTRPIIDRIPATPSPKRTTTIAGEPGVLPTVGGSSLPPLAVASTTTHLAASGSTTVGSSGKKGRSVDEFLKMINRSLEDFTQHISEEQFVPILEEFVRSAPEVSWNKLLSGKGQDHARSLLSKHIGICLSRAARNDAQTP